MSLGINHMNLGEFEKALDLLLKFPDSPGINLYIAECYRALGDSEQAARYAGRARG